MNELMIIENIITGINDEPVEHIQGFPDKSCSALRSIYALIYPVVKNINTDPAYKAASILSIISVAGGLITVNSDGYRCNNGFIDSFCRFYDSMHPVAENLRIMSSDYHHDDYFVDKALGYFSHNTEKRVKNLRDYAVLTAFSLERCENVDDREMIQTLLTIMEQLSKPVQKEELTTDGWDHEKWLEEFLPIWFRRIRWEQHQFRAAYYKKHVALVKKGCYISQSGKEVHIPWDAYKMMESSKLYSEEIKVNPTDNEFETKIEVWRSDCLDAAKILQNETEGVTAVLNLANRQNPGGGVFTGSGAQEESCFLRSNYYTALYPFAEYAHMYDLPRAEQHYPLNRDFGGVWSQEITVFRGRELQGYPLLDKPWKTNFIAVPAINRPQTIECEGEIRLSPDMVQGTLNKIHTIMNIAADNNVTNLVLGAMGCGAFRKPPKHIAELFKQVLEEPMYKNRFNRIIFAIINDDLCDIFSKVFGIDTLKL